MILVIDVETTGLDPTKHAVIELGAVLLDEDLEFAGTYSTRIHPRYAEIDATAMAINKIDVSTLGTAPWPGEAIRSFVDWLKYKGVTKENTNLAGWNVAFDIGFLKATFSKAIVEWPFGYRSLEIQSVNAFLNGFKFESLRTAAEHLSGTQPDHSALRDAITTAEILRHLVVLQDAMTGSYHEFNDFSESLR